MGDTVSANTKTGISVVDSQVVYPGQGQGIPLLLVENAKARALISLYGSQVLSFAPHGKPDFLWLSPRADLTAGKAIRGGIPLCLPWFGPGAQGSPSHGFARNSLWSLSSVKNSTENDSTKLVFSLKDSAATRKMWKHGFSFSHEIIIGPALELSIEARNEGDEAADLEFAWHTYFSVPSLADSAISGLENTDYTDKLDGDQRKHQSGSVRIEGPTDRVYLDVPGTQVLSSGKTRIEIASKTNCGVVWNVWTKDAEMADMGAGTHLHYLCLERGDVGPARVNLKPGTSYAARMTLSSPSA